MSSALIRRQLGLWLGSAAALLAWLLEGPAMTVAALAVALALLLAARELRPIERLAAADRRPRRDLLGVSVAGAWWGLAAGALLAAPVVRAVRAGHDLHRWGATPAFALGHAHVAAPWELLIDSLVAAALVSSLLAARALRRPERLVGESSPMAFDRARGIVAEHGDDSLSPYILRPDKELQFASDAVVAFAVIGETVVISGDPVGPPPSAREALGALVERAHRAGMRVAAYGVSGRHLESFRALGLRAIRAGEEAVVDPRSFTLEGRPVRKLRQSVHRLRRRGWRVTIHDGREIDGELEAAIDAVQARWRSEHERILGFAMSMGEFEPAIGADDLYVLAWSPAGEVRGCARFLAHRGKLSLDAILRVGEAPNGLAEALVCHALCRARARGVEEVSLNYAGLAHLLRADAPGGRLGKALARRLLGPLHGRFQMDRLVLFNQKFSPTWQPRYLVFESRAALPRAILRVLQAEGYLPAARPAHRSPRGRMRLPKAASFGEDIGG
jgi:lysyl-tRNA synthetase class 2